MAQNLELKLPAIPHSATPEMHQYFMELHRNIKRIESYVNSLNQNLNNGV